MWIDSELKDPKREEKLLYNKPPYEMCVQLHSLAHTHVGFLSADCIRLRAVETAANSAEHTQMRDTEHQ